MADQKISFVYTLHDKLVNKTYVGMHVGTLDDGYICSSKPVLKAYRERKTDFTRRIVCIGTKEYCADIEVALQREYLKDKETCYNQQVTRLIIIPPEKMAERNRKAGIAISAAQKGKKLPPERREKAVAALIQARKKMKSKKGIKLSDATRLKMSVSKKGKPGIRIGHKATEETREKLRVSHLGYVPPQSQRDALSKGSTTHWAKVKAAGCRTLPEYKALMAQQGK